MSSVSYIRAKIDSHTKQQAIAILKSQGWNMSDFLRHAVQAMVREHQPECKEQEVPVLSSEDIALFGGIEQATKTMSKADLIKSIGLK